MAPGKKSTLTQCTPSFKHSARTMCLRLRPAPDRKGPRGPHRRRGHSYGWTFVCVSCSRSTERETKVFEDDSVKSKSGEGDERTEETRRTALAKY